jgi:glucose-1-phosphate cytidylyltransferase
MTKVVILCGGKGTRLREETEYKPKPMVEIQGKPILWHIMSHYSMFNLYDFVLCLGYKGEVVKEYFYNYEFMNNDFTVNLGSGTKTFHFSSNFKSDWNVTLANTGQNSLTGSRIKQIEKYIDGDYFLATYGDAVSDINIDDLIKFHKKTGKIATLTGVKPPSKYGMLETDGTLVKTFNEKPELNGYVSGGFFVFERRIFDFLSAEQDCMLEGKPLEKLAKSGQLAIYHHDGFWQCMDTYRDYQLLNKIYEKRGFIQETENLKCEQL